MLETWMYDGAVYGAIDVHVQVLIIKMIASEVKM